MNREVRVVGGTFALALWVFLSAIALGRIADSMDRLTRQVGRVADALDRAHPIQSELE